MPQDKKRVHRQAMLAERRRLQKALEQIEAGEQPAGDDVPANRDGSPMSADEMRARVQDLERQLHLKVAGDQ